MTINTSDGKEFTVAEFAKIQNSLNSCEFSYEARYFSFCCSPKCYKYKGVSFSVR